MYTNLKLEEIFLEEQGDQEKRRGQTLRKLLEQYLRLEMGKSDSPSCQMEQ